MSVVSLKGYPISSDSLGFQDSQLGGGQYIVYNTFEFRIYVLHHLRIHICIYCDIIYMAFLGLK